MRPLPCGSLTPLLAFASFSLVLCDAGDLAARTTAESQTENRHPSKLPVAGDPCSRGKEALQRRDLKAAEDLLNQCLSSRPSELEPYLHLCALYQLQGNTPALLETARVGLERFPTEPRFHLTVGTHAGREGRYEEAILVFTEGHRRWPADPRFRKGLADSHLEFGMRLLDEGKSRESERELRRASELSPEDEEAWLNLGRALHNLNQSTEALEAFERVLRLNSKAPLAHFHQGLVLFSLAEYEASLAAFDREVASGSEYPPTYLFRGLTRMMRGERDAALADLDVASAKMPDNARAHFARARCLTEVGQLEAAEEAFRKAIALDPSDPGPMNALGNLLVRAGRHREARELFRSAAELSKKIRSAEPGEIRFESARIRNRQ